MNITFVKLNVTHYDCNKILIYYIAIHNTIMDYMSDKCSKCDNIRETDDCEKCKEQVCGECLYLCHRCNIRVCFECIYFSDSCEYDHCKECASFICELCETDTCEEGKCTN